MVWSSAARNMPSISPVRMVKICLCESGPWVAGVGAVRRSLAATALANLLLLVVPAVELSRRGGRRRTWRVSTQQVLGGLEGCGEPLEIATEGFRVGWLPVLQHLAEPLAAAGLETQLDELLPSALSETATNARPSWGSATFSSTRWETSVDT